ncbi:hypothetical protein [Plantactinospora sp. CA-290183]|uniref:hypothetical protein n=1 Tax=Plantactinospora sp. CA-290183 TaxID=3240006 RepID=UPI003D8BC9FC
MNRHRRFPAPLAAFLAASLVFGGAPASAQPPAAAKPAPGPSTAADPASPPDPSTVARQQRDQVLPKGWQASADTAWTTSGDSTGFHLLVAESKTGYTWRTAATLVEPLIQSDQWIGNACLTGSGDRAVVVYQPRHFTNRSHLFDRGAFAAIVDLGTGRVTKLDLTVSVAYHNPGCGAGETAVLSQGGATDLGRTRLHVVDTTRGSTVSRHELAGQVTSAVPFRDGVAAAEGGRIFALAADGTRTTVTETAGVAAYLRPNAAGGLSYLEMADEATTVVRHTTGGGSRELARGPLAEVGLSAGTGGRAFITGNPKSVAATLPAGVRQLAVPVRAAVSTLGQVAVSDAGPTRSTVAGAAAPRPAPGDARPVNLEARVPATGRTLGFQVGPFDRTTDRIDEGRRPAPMFRVAAATRGASPLAAGSSTNPVDDDRYCSVPRNDVRFQVEQPHWQQIEWAANLAVQRALTIQRPANWRGTGLPAWSPQGMLPPRDLAGGGRVPAQIMLGILAQESNLWQASWHALEGVPANPLIGNYYGIENEDGWLINWADADCGYGVGQVTDGMRLAGKGRPGEVIRPLNEQRAIAADYATNIAAGLRILQDKWNQLYNLGIRVNNSDPSRIENWFAAVWAYNTGLNPQAVTGGTGCSPGPSCTDDRGNWGLGWSQNPANPDYPFNRLGFLNGLNGEGSPGDAARPNQWPYPEKVMGWAAFPIVKSDFRTPDDYYPGYLQAWWTSPVARTSAIRPPVRTFCTTANNCSVNPAGQGSCGYSDFHCWWHWPVVTKSVCEQDCGYENLRFSPGAAEPARGTHYPPECAVNGIPSNALIVDDQPDDVPVIRSDRCATPTTNRGTFSLQFSGTSAGLYPSKVDMHQIGAGLDGHFWFAHEQNDGSEAAYKVKVTGTWRLGQTLNQWARVFVHMPGHGADSQQAHYTVDRGASATPAASRYKTRTLPQRQGDDRWVPLGVFQFNGTPTISMSNVTRNGGGLGVDNVAWDAVAFVPLSAKPRNFVVALGESYSSGEGAATNAALDYYHDSNHNGDGMEDYRNGCHRSRHAWSRKAFLRDDPQQRSIGTRADSLDPNMDYHLLACSGSETDHLLPTGVNPISGKRVNDPLTGAPFRNAWGDVARGARREVSQLDKGFLDENTTLVSLSIGGNDIKWSAALQNCILLPIPCQEAEIDGQRAADYLPRLMQFEMRESVLTVLRAIAQEAPNAKIMLMGYPELMDNDGNCVEWLGYGISDSEADWINQTGRELSDVLGEIAAAARTAGIQARFADPIANMDFAGQAICGNPETIHGIVAAKTDGEVPDEPLQPSQQSFHPKVTGTTNYASTFNRELRNWGL